MIKKKILNIDELPDILTPQQVADYLGISRTRVYAYCQISESVGGMRSYTIGKSRKIDKTDLITWKERIKISQQKDG